MNFSLPSFSLRHPITVVMVLVSVAVAGTIAWYRMPLKFLPDMDLPYVGCFVPYTGASPSQVEKEIAIPAEGEFRTIPNLKRIYTYSSNAGCRINMQFESGTAMATASAEVRDRVERLKLVLPQEVDRIFIYRHSSNSIPVMAFGLFKEGNEEEFIHLVRTIGEPRLSRVDGVAEVQIFASKPEPEVLIEFDQDKLRTHNVPLYQVITNLQMANLNLSVGELLDGETKCLVRVVDEFTRPESLADIIVSSSGLRLRDVAKVGFRSREMEGHYDIDGKGGAFIIVRKESEANTVETCQALKEEMERLKEDPVFAGSQDFVFFDQSEMVLSALNGLIDAGRGGGMLAILVLYLFLLRLRPTLVVALAIPVSLLAALAVMFFWGMSLNVVTMVSLIVAVGMLVDDAIVVIENIYRHIQLGRDHVESAERGTNEVGIAITASTITTVVVFIPVFYMQRGEMSEYMKEFAVPITAALFASLFVAFTLIPLAVGHMRERKTRHLFVSQEEASSGLVGKRGFFERAFAVHPLTHVINAYGACLNFVLHRRLASMLVIILIMAATVAIPYRKVGIQNMPTLDMRQVNVDVKLDQNFDMAMAADLFDVIGKAIDKQREELGIKNVFRMFTRAGGKFEIHLIEADEAGFAGLKYGTQDVLGIISERLPKAVPGAELTVCLPETGEGGDSEKSINLRMRGDDTLLLTQYAERFKTLLETLENVSDVRVDTERAKQEVQLRVDEALAQSAGISPMVIARTVDIALRGARLPYMKQAGREFPVWAQFQEEDRKRRDNLENVAVVGSQGALVPLNQLVTFDKAKSPMEIRRVDAKSVVQITARVGGKDMVKIQKDIQALINNFELPSGYSVHLGEQFEEIAANLANFAATLLLAIILIYIVMATLFESLLLPLSILVSVPLAFIGVYWGLFFMETSLDTVGLIGCILMVGVVVKNGIVIVDHINLLRNEGLDRLAAAVQAGKDRFRPVMMTALTTILGVAPLAMESQSGSTISFVSLGRAFISGLSAGTLLTLVVVPLLYSVIEDAADQARGFLADCSRLAGRPVAEDSNQ